MGSAALTKSYPALAETVPRVRSELTELALAAGADDDVLSAIRLAASEALTNAVRHAYDGGPGEVHVTAAVTDGEMWLLVADDGAGMSARRRSPGLGMGLALIACAADYFALVKRANGGTEIQLRFELAAEPSSGPRQSGASIAPA